MDGTETALSGGVERKQNFHGNFDISYLGMHCFLHWMPMPIGLILPRWPNGQTLTQIHIILAKTHTQERNYIPTIIRRTQ